MSRAISLEPPKIESARQLPRDSRLDFLRGLCLIVMTIDHLPPTALHRFSYETIGYITAAGGFVLISGITSGLAFGGIAHPGRRIFVRCGVIYFTYLLLILTLWLTSPTPSSNWSWQTILSMLAGNTGQWGGRVAGILCLYVVLLLPLTVVLRLFKAGYSTPLLCVSFGLWIVGQWRLGPQLGFGYILAWQFLFTAGVWLGYARLRRIHLPRILSRHGLKIGIIGCLIFFLLRHPIVLPPILELGWGITSKEALGAARLANLTLLALLVASIPETLVTRWTKFVPYRASCFLGSHSLQVFAGHVLIVNAIDLTWWLTASWIVQALVAAVTVSLLFVPAYAHQYYRALVGRGNLITRKALLEGPVGQSG